MDAELGVQVLQVGIQLGAQVTKFVTVTKDSIRPETCVLTAK